MTHVPNTTHLENQAHLVNDLFCLFLIEPLEFLSMICSCFITAALSRGYLITGISSKQLELYT